MSRPPSHSRRIEIDSPLEAYYTFDPAVQPKSDSANLQVHGLAHGSIQFQAMSGAMNHNEGISTARLDIYSNGNNFIGMNRYRDVIPAAIQQIWRETGVRIGSIAAHSMGGEETQEAMQEFPEILLPTAYLAPIPTGGAMKGAMKIDKKLIWNSMKTLEIREVMRTREQIKLLFLDETVDDEDPILEELRQQMEHTSYWAYTQLLMRPLIRPRIRDTGLPTMLIRSDSDFLFDNASYKGMRRIFSQLEEHVLPGGHDFFVRHPEETARLIADFHKQNAV